MKRLNQFLAAIAAYAVATSVNAAVATSLTMGSTPVAGSFSVLAGQSETFTLSFADPAPPLGASFAEYIGAISYALGSGDGQLFSGSITLPSYTSNYSISTTFTYAQAGTFNPWASGLITALEYSYPGGVTISVPGAPQPPSAPTAIMSNFSINQASLLPVVGAVPEPSSYALMLAGLGLAVFAARRRRPSPRDLAQGSGKHVDMA